MKIMSFLLALMIFGAWSGSARANLIQSESLTIICLTPGLTYPLEKPIDDGTLIFLQPCDRFNPLMQFDTESVGTNPVAVEIRVSVLSGGRSLCLQPYDDHPTDGTPLTARLCSGLKSQLWYPSYDAKGTVSLKLMDVAPGGAPVCIDAGGGEKGKFGIMVRLSTCKAGLEQRFLVR